MSTTHQHQLTTTDEARTFVLGGNATFTVVSAATGKRFTYKVATPKDNEHGPHFVKLLTGSDNEGDYTFLSTVFERATWRHGRRSAISQDAPSAKAFAWLWGKLVVPGAALPGQLEFWTSGKCGRCGRKLTVDSSVAQGFGPECVQAVMPRAA